MLTGKSDCYGRLVCNNGGIMIRRGKLKELAEETTKFQFVQQESGMEREGIRTRSSEVRSQRLIVRAVNVYLFIVYLTALSVPQFMQLGIVG